MRDSLHAKLRGHEVYQGWEEYYRVVRGETAWKDEEDTSVSMLSQMIPQLGLTKVVDLGCGDGRNLWSWLARGAYVTGIDLSETALSRILQNCRKRSIAHPLLLACDFSATPLVSNQFDVVQCFDALAQVINPAAAVLEMTRIAKPDGLVCFNVFTPADAAYGEGVKIENNAFAYNDTLFRFFEEDDVDDLLPKSLKVITKERRRWRDPPHQPFRPYEHEHEALYYTCSKATY
jgi:ubiquinone/menaquinone biosynthesis C-methylase UbiE